MKNQTFRVAEILIVMTLTAIQSLAQSSYEPYNFTTLAGGGGYSTNAAGSAARLLTPLTVAVDRDGNLVVADTDNHTIRKVTPHGVVFIVAGRPDSFGSTDGTRNAARFNAPSCAALDNAGNVYVADFYFNTIRKGFPAPMILNLGFNLGQFTFDLTGPTGRSVVVEASSDLVTWLPVWTNTFAGPLNFSEPGISSNRFYRTRIPQ